MNKKLRLCIIIAVGIVLVICTVSITKTHSSSVHTPIVTEHKGLTPEQLAIIKAEEEKTKAEYAEWQKTPAGKLCEKHPDWSRKTCDNIIKEIITIGMTKEQVTLAIGKPDRINKSGSKYGVEEQWVYGYNYAYFDTDGILTNVQQSQ